LGENDRCRFIFDKAIERELDKPELAWKAFIDFEIGEKELENARQLYWRLLEETHHFKVWLSFARFEYEDAKSNDKAWEIFEEAAEWYKSENSDSKEERAMILENWLSYEEEIGDEEKIKEAREWQPSKTKKRVKVGEDQFEEWFEYLFPDDKQASAQLKILDMAKKWKQS